MLKSSDNERLTRVGKGTPMGELMRRYWHPIAPAAELDANPMRTKEVRLLGEDLVLFRDRGGRLALLDRFCSHRRVNLAMGMVEDDGIRCPYHGWEFGIDGTCVE
jgi:phenylpropionate dioxygenase-like ring-hydroxylating dioxygenase large terminal subunit